jgi:21S rRNA (GM2251-2'-O)-methyltransferase
VNPLLYPALCTFRAASLNSAINHGIRRSKGVGFRGRERSGTQDAGQSYGGRDELRRRPDEPFRSSTSRSQMRTTGSEDRPSKFSAGTRNGSSKFRGSASALGKAGFRTERSAIGKPRGVERDTRSFGKATTSPPKDSDRSSFSRRNNEEYSTERVSDERGFREHPSHGRETYPSLSSRREAYDSPSRASHRKEKNLFKQKRTREYGSQGTNFKSADIGRSLRKYGSQERSFRSEDDTSSKQSGSRERNFKSDDRERPPRFESTISKRDDNLPGQLPIDTRMPVSIPYTTTASEFLYGTSVVEAALRSRRVPRRKHYKLYIYNGENRDGGNVERDAGLERLAVKGGVEVVRVSGDWLRVMDKMSGGRPHNGYILEASPLPRQPITSLGELTSIDGQSGYKVSLDHQSREEATVNGVDDFIKHTTNIQGRKPLVLLLDSIVDPGNLGGIVRTASFLGVSAIAISTRNSASFTPVVLKASAGASENVTLFSVNKPAGFLVDSKAAGWRIYAAVAPSSRKDPDVAESITTDDLEDPLSEDPCILMLGSEGEGLRRNLQSKADVNLSIRGSNRSHNVDSLNVSVAAGILCSSFLRRSNVKINVDPTQEPKVEANPEPAGDLF